jgi:hypothetical protein
MALVARESTVHVATVVLRPIDALKERLQRPESDRGPIRPTRFRLAGKVVGGVVQPLARGRRKPVVNLSGDTVLRDFDLPAATYRIEIDRPGIATDGIYEEIDPAERDLAWDPAAPQSGLPPTFPAHPSRFVPIRLFPGPAYAFPVETTLVRGSLLWYDGSPLDGAVARLATALLTRSRVAANGDFVLALAPTAASGTVNVQLDLAGVDPATRFQGAAYLGAFPAAWQAAWERGTSRAVRQGALTGQVRLTDGRPLAGATVQLAGRPGRVQTDRNGRWSYHFPPSAGAGVVDVSALHPGHPIPPPLPNVPFPADATATAPIIVMN